MTQPDQYFPDTATNALSFADYAATTQEDWEDQIHGDTASHFNIAEIAFETLLDWVEQIPLIGPAIVAAITGVEAGIEFLADWFGDLMGIFGNPLGLGTGSINMPDLGDIPLLGPLLEGLLTNPVEFLGQLPQSIVNGLESALASLDQWITDIIIGIGNALDDIPIVGRDLEAALLRLFNVRQKAVTADTRSTQIVEDVTAAWANDTPTGTPTPVFDTIVAIRESFVNGYTVLTFTSNDSWTVPAGLTELWYIVIGGGGKGVGGQARFEQEQTALGGAGGSSGGYRSEQIDPSTLTAGSTVAITVGAAASTPGADGGVTSIGSVASVKDVGSISTPFGYSTSTSKPGAGGAGGNARFNIDIGHIATGGIAGEPSAAATGGAAGAGGTGSGGAGGAGGNASVTVPIKSGGGGGGGGGGRRVTDVIFQGVTGGTGGNGGYPGGGSGGGGGAHRGSTANAATGGAAGTPGNGIAFIMYKAAS